MKNKRWGIILIWFLIICLLAEISLHWAGRIYLENLYLNLSSGKMPPSQETITILCLGESSTAGLWVAPEDSYPAQLERMLREEYPQKDIKVIVPPHLGQNTSQMSNRIKSYLKLYAPKIIILMAGANNEWSLAESHIVKFLNLNKFDSIKIRILILLDGLHIFKLLKYFYFKYIVRERSQYVKALESNKYIWGGPELVKFPPPQYVYEFAKAHRKAFVKLWEYDLKKIISQAKKNNINVILMTYHINPEYLPLEASVSLAKEEKIGLVRNDILFKQIAENGQLNKYLIQDGWHPNKQGYSLIAKNVFQFIKEKGLLE